MRVRGPLPLSLSLHLDGAGAWRHTGEKAHMRASRAVVKIKLSLEEGCEEEDEVEEKRKRKRRVIVAEDKQRLK